MAAFLNAKLAVERRIERERNRIAGQKFADLEAADRDPDHELVSAEKKKRKSFAEAPQEKEADSVPQTPPETVPVTEPIREPADEQPIRVRPGRMPKVPSAPEEKPAATPVAPRKEEPPEKIETPPRQEVTPVAPRKEEPPEKIETPPRQEATPVAPRKEEPPKKVGTPPRQEAAPVAPRKEEPLCDPDVPIAPTGKAAGPEPFPIAPSARPESGDVPIAPSGQKYTEEQQEILFVRGTIPKNHSVHSGPNGLIIG